MITGRKNWLTFGGAPVSGQENGKKWPGIRIPDHFSVFLTIAE